MSLHLIGGQLWNSGKQYLPKNQMGGRYPNPGRNLFPARANGKKKRRTLKAQVLVDLKKRIFIEHIICFINRFRILSERYRRKRPAPHFPLFAGICNLAALLNFARTLL